MIKELTYSSGPSCTYQLRLYLLLGRGGGLSTWQMYCITWGSKGYLLNIWLTKYAYGVGIVPPKCVEITRGVHSLLYFAYTCIRDLFIGGGGLFTLQKRL